MSPTKPCALLPAILAAALMCLQAPAHAAPEHLP